MPERAATAGQTIGPFFHFGLCYPGANELIPPGHPDAIKLHGSVFDGAGDPVPDALLEVWQADASGAIVAADGSLHRDGWTFTGWGRAATDPEGHYSFTTLTPGSLSSGQAPFFAVTVFARGLLDAVFTRAYLPHGNLTGDPLLASLEPDRHSTMTCRRESDGYRFDIFLQGANETVFLGPSGRRP